MVENELLSEVKIYTLNLTTMIKEYLYSKNLNYINQLSNEEFIELSKVSGNEFTLKEFEHTYNTQGFKFDFVRFKHNKEKT
jgi:hypothetical protein